MPGVRQITRSVVLIALCLVAAATATQAAGSAVAAVPRDLRAQVLRLGVLCSQLPALNHQDCVMLSAGGSRTKQRQFAPLYQRALKLCQFLKPSSSDGSIGEIVVEHRQKHSYLLCLWGRSSRSPRRVELVIDLPNPGYSMSGAACDMYGKVLCIQFPIGVQVTRPYGSSTGYGSLLINHPRGYVEVARWATTTDAYNTCYGGDLSLLNRTAAVLGLPRQGE